MAFNLLHQNQRYGKDFEPPLVKDVCFWDQTECIVGKKCLRNMKMTL